MKTFMEFQTESRRGLPMVMSLDAEDTESWQFESCTVFSTSQSWHCQKAMVMDFNAEGDPDIESCYTTPPGCDYILPCPGVAMCADDYASQLYAYAAALRAKAEAVLRRA